MLGGSRWACLAAKETGSLVFVDLLSANKNNTVDSEVFLRKLMIFSKVLEQHFTVLRKQPQNYFRPKRWHVTQWQSPDPNPTEHAFHLMETKLKAECPSKKQVGSEDIFSRGLAEHHQG